MNLRRLRSLAIFAMLAAGGSLHAAEQRPAGSVGKETIAVDDARIDRLTDLVAEMIPVGKIMELVAASDPEWPMQDAPDAVNATQLACLRAELGDPAYRRWKRTEIADYIRRNPENVDRQIATLEAGASKYFGRYAMVGARSRMPGADAVGDDGGEPSRAELESVEEVATASEFRELRDISGLTVLLDMADPNKKKEKGGVQGLIAPFFMRALETCDVSLPEPPR